MLQALVCADRTTTFSFDPRLHASLRSRVASPAPRLASVGATALRGTRVGGVVLPPIARCATPPPRLLPAPRAHLVLLPLLNAGRPLVTTDPTSERSHRGSRQRRRSVPVDKKWADMSMISGTTIQPAAPTAPMIRMTPSRPPVVNTNAIPTTNTTPHKANGRRTKRAGCPRARTPSDDRLAISRSSERALPSCRDDPASYRSVQGELPDPSGARSGSFKTATERPRRLAALTGRRDFVPPPYGRHAPAIGCLSETGDRDRQARPLSDYVLDGPARIRTWARRIMSPLL